MPTYGRVSNRGVIPMSWTLDHVGPICKTVEDAALMLGVIAGYDPADPTAADLPVPDDRRAFQMPVSRLRVGLPRHPFFDGLDAEFAKAVDEAIQAIRKLVAGVADVELPPAAEAPTVWGPETYAYHAKWLAESPEKYQAATRSQMISANNVKPDVYAAARHRVDVARREIKRVFEKVDVLVTPTLKAPPATIGASLNGNPGSLGNPWAFDVYGIPAITVPCGFTASGLPIGLQISAAPFAETTMLALARAYEQATEWHKRRPNLRPS
jgi:aspartyl-tRNA(Asn)/glutamyl-tRNA(Gln) amidotransferase subunit A